MMFRDRRMAWLLYWRYVRRFNEDVICPTLDNHALFEIPHRVGSAIERKLERMIDEAL